MPHDDRDRLSDQAIRLVVPKRRPTGALADLPEHGDATARAEALLERLDRTLESAARARILVEIAITLRDGLADRAQAIDALLEAWRVDPTNDEKRRRPPRPTAKRWRPPRSSGAIAWGRATPTSARGSLRAPPARSLCSLAAVVRDCAARDRKGKLALQ